MSLWTKLKQGVFSNIQNIKPISGLEAKRKYDEHMKQQGIT